MRPAIAVLGLAALFAAGCEKKTRTGTTTAATQPSAGAGQTGYVAGGGAIQNARQAARRTEVLNEMNTLGTVIADYDATYGKMPNKQEVEATLRQYPKVAALVKDGSIVLTGSSNRGGCWAYQFEADTKGGIVLVGGRASRMSAEEAARAIQNQ